MPPVRGGFSRRQIVGLVVAGLALVVIVDFSQRLAQSQRLVEQRDMAATDVAILEQEQNVLQTQVAYATTDASVIEWAHSSAMMVQPGEMLAVPVLPTQPATPPPPLPTPLPPPPNYELWAETFFNPGPRVP
jgi:hypothetical protein